MLVRNARLLNTKNREIKHGGGRVIFWRCFLLTGTEAFDSVEHKIDRANTMRP